VHACRPFADSTDNVTPLKTDMDGVVFDTANLAAKCLEALTDLDQNTWEGQEYTLSYYRSLSKDQFRRNSRRTQHRLRNSAIFFGTQSPDDLDEKQLKDIMMHGLEDKDKTRLEAPIKLVSELAAFYKTGAPRKKRSAHTRALAESDTRQWKEINEEEKPFLACGSKACQ